MSPMMRTTQFCGHLHTKFQRDAGAKPISTLSFRVLLTVFLVTLGLMMSLGAPAMANGGGEKKKGGGLLYVQLQPISSYMHRAKGKNAIITLEVGIDTPNDAAKEKAELLIPRLRSALVDELQRYASAKTDMGPINADALSARLQKAADGVLGAGVGKVLIGTLMVT